MQSINRSSRNLSMGVVRRQSRYYLKNTVQYASSSTGLVT